MRNLLREKIVFKLFFMLFVSICIPIIIFSAISYYMSYRSIYDSYMDSKGNLNNQIAQNIKENFNVLKSQSIALYNFENISYVLDTDTENLTEEYINNYNSVYGSLVSIIQGNFKLDCISMFDLEGEVKFFYDRNMASQNLKTVGEEGWFQAAMDANGRAVIVAPHENNYTNSHEQVVSVCRTIVNPYNDKTVGVLKIDQKMKTFEQIFANVEREEGEINIVYDDQGNVFYSNSDLDEKEMKDIFQKKGFNDLGSEKIITWGESTDNYWKMVSILDSENIAAKAEFIKRNNTVLTVILFFVCTALSIMVSVTINIPIRKLISSIKSFQNGNMYEQVDIKRRDEFGSIANAFNNMIANIRNLINKEYKLELLKKQAEFENYQSQINPHFLFNTLNSIKAEALQGDSGKTADMIQYLSDNFRYSLNRGVYIVSFLEELEYIDKYIYLQKIRFHDKYTIIKEIDDDVLDNEIPRMILQPIIENAFKHGLEKSVREGEIKIVALNVRDEFNIYVSNTGKTIEEDKLKEINEQLAVKEDQYVMKNKDKVGIFNVNARIRYYYGEQYGLKFISSQDHQTTVRIRYPKVKVIKGEQRNENTNY
ncbi:sensor histidine kinase [uncultured Robinsoniella sp.]|uniref:cache domain-containing sensor histidine kinase n=1 Tax=uncultured Robinsoniella sp. TaxID=904190 RepID=UPI00374EFBC3